MKVINKLKEIIEFVINETFHFIINSLHYAYNFLINNPTVIVTGFAAYISYQVYRATKFNKALDAMKDFSDICNSYLISNDDLKNTEAKNFFPKDFHSISAIASTIIKADQFINEYYNSVRIPPISSAEEKDKKSLRNLFKYYLHTTIIEGISTGSCRSTDGNELTGILKTLKIQFADARKILSINPLKTD
ncbi:hypothetical protein [Komagataeibacter xylinus]|uniref:hypothetical protein n=1 Tax=Komagataeibacter xylinus TaxID=28448 RepID=UPI001013D54A|nr:hypothetical protein [Komagataeibacter xylinus]